MSRALLVYLICSIAAYQQALAQGDLYDSLRLAIRKAPSASQRSIALQEICHQFFMSSRQDSLSSYFPLLNDDAKKLKEEKLIALAGFYVSQSFFRAIDTVRFFETAFSALRMAKESNCFECLALGHLGLGLKYRNLQQYPKAVEQLKLGLTIVQNLKEKKRDAVKSYLHLTLSAVHHYQGKYAEALRHGLDGLRMAESLNDLNLMQKGYNSLSAVYAELYSPDNNLGTAPDRQRYKGLAKKYMIITYEGSLLVSSKRASGVAAYNLGLFYSEEKKVDSAAYYLDKSIVLGRESGFSELLSNAYNIKGSDCAESKPDLALLYFNQAIAYAEESGFISNQATAMISKANIFQRLGQQGAALKLAQEALALSLQSDVTATTLNAYKLLAELYEQSGNPIRAYAYFKKHIAIKDSLVSQENFAQIEELKAQYDVELKDSEIKNLNQTASIQALEINQRNVVVLSLLIFILLASVSIWLYIRQRNIAQQQKHLDLENRFLRFQLNPHFLSNALVSIQRYMFDNNVQSAADYLSKFSRMMRQFLEYSRKELITIEDEIEVLRNYVAIQQLGLIHGFTFNLTIDEALDVEADKIPPMFGQPFIENALEHGIRGMINGILDIRLLKREGFLLFEVEDNGVGMNNTKPETTNHVSLATTIIRERMELLNKGRKEKIRLSITVPHLGAGTLVQLWLPIYS